MKIEVAPQFNKLCRDPPKEHHIKFEANPCRSSREVKKVHNNDNDAGHRVIARVTLAH